MRRQAEAGGDGEDGGNGTVDTFGDAFANGADRPPKETKPMSPDAREEALEWSDSGAREGTDWPEYPE